MTDDPPPAAPLPAASAEHALHPYRFEPVPRRGDRHDGWSSDRQHAFVWALARLPSVAAAARGVGMSARSAYRLRRAPGALAFATAWDDAMEIGIDRARDTAIERTMDGVEVPIVRRGRVIGHERRYPHRLLTAVLAHDVAEAKGLTALHARLAYARAKREADARLGGPVDWNAGTKRRAAELKSAGAEQALRITATQEAERLRDTARAAAGQPVRQPRRMVGGARVTAL